MPIISQIGFKGSTKFVDELENIKMTLKEWILLVSKHDSHQKKFEISMAHISAEGFEEEGVATEDKVSRHFLCVYIYCVCVFEKSPLILWKRAFSC